MNADTFLRQAFNIYYLDPHLAMVRAMEGHLLSLYPREAPVLDIGCGDGVFSMILQDRVGDFDNYQFHFLGRRPQKGDVAQKAEVGMDLRHKEIEKAKELAVYKTLIVANAEQLPLAGESVRTVVSNCTLEHVPNIGDAIREISRVLVPGGRLLFSVPYNSFGENLLFSTILRNLGFNKLSKWYIQKRNRELVHYHCLPIQAWKEKLEEAGLKMSDHWFYLDRRSEIVWDVLYLLSRVGIWKFSVGASIKLVSILLNRMGIGLHKRVLVSIGEGLLKGLCRVNREGGGCIFIVAEKV